MMDLKMEINVTIKDTDHLDIKQKLMDLYFTLADDGRIIDSEANFYRKDGGYTND